MEAVFKYELDNLELDSIKKFCNSVDYCSLEQSVGWIQMLYKTKICYFYLLDENRIKSFCQINERLRSAKILYGPVCCEKEAMVNSINEIINYYKKRGFYYIGIQMYYKSGFDTEYIEYKLNKLHNIKYIFNSENTKSSIELDLEESLEDIWRKMRKGHRNGIKNAVKLGVTFDVVKDKSELDSFMEIYLRMCKARNYSDYEITTENIHKIYNYLIENNKGEVLIARDKDGIILGGEILVYQGISVRCWKGASDPDKRDISTSHLLLYEAIKKAKNENFKYFDLWGYNHFADENNHVFYINHFKKGFGGDITFFAKKMNVDLMPFGTIIFRFLYLVRRILNRLF